MQGSFFDGAKRLERLRRIFERALRTLDPSPTENEALAAQAAFYDATDVVEDAKESAGLSRLEQILAERWMRAGDDVLDVGCGTGREALQFATRGMKVTAIDVSERSIDVARERAARNCLSDRVSTRTGDVSSHDLPKESFDVIFFASDVFASIPGRENRARVLRRAGELLRAEGRVFVQAMVPDHWLRAAVLDGAREVTARLRGTRHERGDRWISRGTEHVRVFRHVFPDDEAIVDELEHASLSFVARCGSYVVAQKCVESRREQPPPRALVHEARNVFRALPHVDHVRKTHGPKPAATLLRSEAASAPRRDARGRARLARAIALCDRLYPFGRAGCYRRALLEIALDAGAASEPLHLGLADPEGHAWLPRAWPAERYSAVFTI